MTNGCGLQHTNDFALYTEAIKFFNHPESMVRIAVRTITLNVYKGKGLALFQFRVAALWAWGCIQSMLLAY